MRDALQKLYWDISSAGSREQYIAFLIRNLPGGFGMAVRRAWYGRRFRKCGKNLNILEGAFIINPQNVECGDNVSVGVCNYIQAGGGVVLESDVLLGPYVKIWTQNHNYKDYHTPIHSQGYAFSPVEIGNDVWVGANAFIMPGVRIGAKSIVSANSVVGAKVYPEGSILAGYPARKIGERRPDEKHGEDEPGSDT